MSKHLPGLPFGEPAAHIAVPLNVQFDELLVSQEADSHRLAAKKTKRIARARESHLRCGILVRRMLVDWGSFRIGTGSDVLA